MSIKRKNPAYRQNRPTHAGLKMAGLMTPQNGMFYRVHPETALFLFPVQRPDKTAGRLAVAEVLLAITTDALVYGGERYAGNSGCNHLTG